MRKCKSADKKMIVIEDAVYAIWTDYDSNRAWALCRAVNPFHMVDGFAPVVVQLWAGQRSRTERKSR